MSISLRALPLAACLIFSPTLFAGSSGYAVGLKLGVLLGAGIEGTAGLIDDKLNLRVGFNGGKIEFDDLELESDSAAQSGMDVDADFDFGSIQAFADFYPFAGRFRVTGGVLANGNKVNGSAVCNSPGGCNVAGETFLQGDRADLTVEWEGVAPYLGFGFGNPVSGDKGLGFMFDLGIALQGSPDTRFTTNSSSCGSSCQATIEDELEEETEQFDVLPVISFGLNFQF